jgi:hypothetical protein
MGYWFFDEEVLARLDGLAQMLQMMNGWAANQDGIYRGRKSGAKVGLNIKTFLGQLCRTGWVGFDDRDSGLA